MSDWVVTVDRTLGSEYFDHGRRGRSEYVIDHTTVSHGGLGHQVVVSSRSAGRDARPARARACRPRPRHPGTARPDLLQPAA
ncbi:hypothetical protein LT493_33965 [Streptomyces tricolor]|nr:hypothetical protein [Streptomyces tricolor]